jgi:hypothetical protein
VTKNLRAQVSSPMREGTIGAPVYLPLDDSPGERGRGRAYVGRENAATADLGGGRAVGGGAAYTGRGKGVGRSIAVGRLGPGEGGRGRALP